MDQLDLVSIYGIVVAILVAGLWVASLSMHRVPELQTKPWEIRLHIAAEAMLSATLLVGGIATLMGADVGPPILAIGLGMTLYSIVNSSGYYVERHQLPPVVMFAVLLVLTSLAAAAMVAGLA